ncbi:LysE family translocator [Hwanghaeella grinnelliae]|uniref:LysE family translocator n=1 Tax=Hwanghaeella grinnelliae TaxID=2500179 RepID=A0A437QN06_9PROT|nr:LysE family translocator [Hwanghaeella grinnelliae]RVU35926.1 LysE family translocator [Hwanghaeella grinnelliae]
MPPIFAMCAFALTLSISPGPVNVLTLSTGLNHGARRALPFVSGATISFTLLLLAIGLGLGAVAESLGRAFDLLAIAGAGLIAWFGFKLATATGSLSTEEAPIPGFWRGVMLQVLNPKAWGACIAAIAIFELQEAPAHLAIFVCLYGVICFFGIGSWAFFGQQVKRFLITSNRLRVFNIALGLSLIVLAITLLWRSLLT